MTDIPWIDLVTEQIDGHWRGQLRPRLEGLTDDEYRWEPVPGAWNVRGRADAAPATVTVRGGSGDTTIDFAYPEPTPAPVTTIAWRLGHLIVGVLATRVAGHFGGPTADYLTWEYAAGAEGALAQLDQQYGAWLAGIRTLDDAALAAPCGTVEGPWAQHPMAALILHIHRELIHHGAEIALLRDIYAATVTP
ncbi:MAG: DinB family protein [Dermatophilaceae bacterium]